MIAVIIAVPEPVQVLAVIGAVYGILQGAKKIPGLAQYITGWKAIALNVALSVSGLLIAIPADQLYTVQTLYALLTTGLSAAGIHGTIKSMSPATVLASIPPSTQVKEVPATLVPDNPAAVATNPPPK